MATVVDEPVPKQGVFEKPTEFAPSPTQKAARRKESLIARWASWPRSSSACSSSCLAR